MTMPTVRFDSNNNRVIVVAGKTLRDRAWEIIEIIGKDSGLCDLTRKSATAFYVSPNDGKDISDCMNIAIVAISIARHVDYEFFWKSFSGLYFQNLATTINIDKSFRNSKFDFPNLRPYIEKYLQVMLKKEIENLVTLIKGLTVEESTSEDVIKKIVRARQSLKFHPSSRGIASQWLIKKDVQKIDDYLLQVELEATLFATFNMQVQHGYLQLQIELERKMEFYKNELVDSVTPFSLLLELGKKRLTELINAKNSLSWWTKIPEILHKVSLLTPPE